MDREKVVKEIEDALSGNLAKVGHVYKLSLNGLKDKALTDALALLEDYDTQLQYRDDHIAMYQAEINRLEALLKEQEAQELTMDEWREWKANPKRNPICKLWENDTSPMWILNPNDVHEPALLMGKLKLFTGKPSFEQCKEVKWNEGVYR